MKICSFESPISMGLSFFPDVSKRSITFVREKKIPMYKDSALEGIGFGNGSEISRYHW